MNSKLVLLTLFFAFSCGVKTKPKAPASSKLPSIIDEYTKEKEKKN